MNHNVLAIVAVILSIIAIGFTGYLYNDNLILHSENENLNEKVNYLENQTATLSGENIELRHEINELNDKYYNLESQFNETIVSQQGEINKLMNSLSDYDAELKNRLSWISANAQITNYPEYTKYDFDNCVQNSEINLGCIGYTMYDKMGFQYIPDEKESNKTDVLFNLTEIYNHGGGDCEDLSLAFAASVRYLMNKYNVHNFVGWKHGDSKFIIYKTNDGEYYMPDAEPFHFKANYVYVMCYEINATEGHCITSFCENKTDGDFSNCIQIEPQAYGEVVNKTGPLMLYISNNNLCMPYNGSIKCFTDFENQIEELLNKK